MKLDGEYKHCWKTQKHGLFPEITTELLKIIREDYFLFMVLLIDKRVVLANLPFICKCTLLSSKWREEKMDYLRRKHHISIVLLLSRKVNYDFFTGVLRAGGCCHGKTPMGPTFSSKFSDYYCWFYDSECCCCWVSIIKDRKSLCKDTQLWWLTSVGFIVKKHSLSPYGQKNLLVWGILIFSSAGIIRNNTNNNTNNTHNTSYTLEILYWTLIPVLDYLLEVTTTRPLLYIRYKT